MNKQKIRIVLILLLSILCNCILIGQNHTCFGKSNDNSKTYLRVNQLKADSVLSLVIDDILTYQFKDSCLLNETYYYVSIHEDSLNQRIGIIVSMSPKDIDTPNNILGAVKKKKIFILFKDNAEILSFITDKYLDLEIIKEDEYLLFDGPRWMYTYYRENKELELLRADFIFPGDLESD